MLMASTSLRFRPIVLCSLYSPTLSPYLILSVSLILFLFICFLRPLSVALIYYLYFI